MSDDLLLGSITPNADVLFYNKEKIYYQGNLELVENGINNDLDLDNNGIIVKATYEYVK